MRNNTLFTLLLSVFIALLGIGIIVPIMPVFAQELGAGGVALGMIIAVFSIVRGLLLPIVGNLSDRWGRKRFLIVGLFIYGIVGLWIPQATTVAQLIGIRGFHGVGSAMIVPIAMAYISLLSPAGHEGRYMSYLNIAIFSGIGCGPLIGGFIYDRFGFTSVFYLMAGMSFLAFILVIFFMPTHVASDKKQTRGLWSSLGSMLKNGRTSGILLARYATMIIMVPTMAFLPLIMSQWQETSGFQIGVVIAGRTIVNAMFQVPFGKVADRYNKRIILLVGCVFLSFILPLIPNIESFLGMFFLYVVLGMVEASVWAVLGAYASIESKEHYGHGTMMGVYSLAMSGGIFTGAILTGLSMDSWGIASAYYIAGGAVFALSLLAVVMITVNTKRKRVA